MTLSAADARYAAYVDSLPDSVKAVHDIVEKFQIDLINQLDAFGDSLSSAEESSIHEYLKEKLKDFGNQFSSISPSIRRGNTPWNGFVHDKYHEKKEEIDANQEYADIIFKNPKIIKAIKSDWDSLSPEAKRAYPCKGHTPSSGKKRKLSDNIISTNQKWKEGKKKLIKQLERLDCDYGVGSVWISCEKEYNGNSQYFLSNYDLKNPLALYYRELTLRHLCAKTAQLYVQSACVGMDVGASRQSANDSDDSNGRKSCDVVRAEYNRVMIDAYNAFAKEHVKPLLAHSSLPQSFHSVYLEKQKCVLEGEAVDRLNLRRPTRQIRISVLLAAIPLFPSKEIKFVATPVPQTVTTQMEMEDS